MTDDATVETEWFKLRVYKISWVTHANYESTVAIYDVLANLWRISQLWRISSTSQFEKKRNLPTNMPVYRADAF